MEIVAGIGVAEIVCVGLLKGVVLSILKTVGFGVVKALPLLVGLSNSAMYRCSSAKSFADRVFGFTVVVVLMVFIAFSFCCNCCLSLSLTFACSNNFSNSWSLLSSFLNCPTSLGINGGGFDISGFLVVVLVVVVVVVVVDVVEVVGVLRSAFSWFCICSRSFCSCCKSGCDVDFLDCCCANNSCCSGDNTGWLKRSIMVCLVIGAEVTVTAGVVTDVRGILLSGPILRKTFCGLICNLCSS
uniref:Uncharacterized protein n=1 Tax=Glossina brevipalpis TaxID=37001 RepID=A0A1A9WCP0_9MUSC